MAKFTGHTITSDSALGDAKIERSLRFNSGDSSYLDRTPSSASNRQTWTFSTWLKSTDPANGSYQTFFSSNNSSNYGANGTYLWFWTTGELGLSIGSGTYYLKTNAKFRDTTSWYHVVGYVDTTQGTSSDRVKLYVNGEEQTDLANATYPTQNYNTEINNTVQHTVGARRYSSIDNHFNGYLAETNFIDGYAYDASYFGFTDPQTGIWMPKRYEGTYGTNGFYLDYSDNSSTATLGIDKSPNGNDWTTSNFSVSAGVGNDSVTDTPTNNFCTLNPLSLTATGANILNGNLDYKSDSNYSIAAGNFTLKTGKWYWEVTITAAMSGGNGQINGIVRGEHPNSNAYVSYDTNGNVYGIGYVYNGSIQGASPDGSTNAPGGASGLATYTEDDVLGFASDIENGTLAFYKNGSLQHTITGLNSYDWFPAGSGYGTSSTNSFNFGQLKTTSTTYADAKGHGSFKYSVPSGFLAMCSANLSPNVPSIVRPQKHFDTLLYTGNDSSDRNIEGLEFKPDFVWIKNREGNDWHMLQDSVRGANKVLFSNRTEGEDTDNTNGHVNYFMNGGFNVTAGDSGNVNENNEDYVAWCWKAGGNSNTFNVDDVGYASASAAGITEGSISLTGASINTKAGFSIVSYTGNGTAGATIGHGLGVAPNWIFAKVRNASRSWAVGTDFSPWTLNIRLEESSGSANTSQSQSQWYETAPTSSVFYVGDGNTGNYSGDTNVNGENYIAYCWTDIPGYSKFGGYTGNGSSDGTYVHLGFRPAFLMVKKTSGANSWVMYDVKRSTTNVIDNYLIAEGTDVDNTNSATNVDLLSNGFKFYSGYDIVNAGDYIYMAFAEQPGVTPFDTFSNAR